MDGRVGLVALVTLALAAGYWLGSSWSPTHPDVDAVESAAVDVASERGLEPAAEEVAQLRDALEFMRARVERYEGATRELSATNEGQRRLIDRLRVSIERERPPVEITLRPSEDLAEIVALARNPGGQPLEITRTQGQLWLGGDAQPVVLGEAAVDVAPGRELEFFRYSLYSADALEALAGTLDVETALCFTYRQPDSVERRPWQGIFWLHLEPDRRMTLTRYEYRPVPSPASPCELTAEARPPA